MSEGSGSFRGQTPSLAKRYRMRNSQQKKIERMSIPSTPKSGRSAAKTPRSGHRNGSYNGLSRDEISNMFRGTEGNYTDMSPPPPPSTPSRGKGSVSGDRSEAIVERLSRDIKHEIKSAQKEISSLRETNEQLKDRVNVLEQAISMLQQYVLPSLSSRLQPLGTMVDVDAGGLNTDSLKDMVLGGCWIPVDGPSSANWWYRAEDIPDLVEKWKSMNGDEDHVKTVNGVHYIRSSTDKAQNHPDACEQTTSLMCVRNPIQRIYQCIETTREDGSPVIIMHSEQEQEGQEENGEGEEEEQEEGE